MGFEPLGPPTHSHSHLVKNCWTGSDSDLPLHFVWDGHRWSKKVSRETRFGQTDTGRTHRMKTGQHGLTLLLLHYLRTWSRRVPEAPWFPPWRNKAELSCLQITQKRSKSCCKFIQKRQRFKLKLTRCTRHVQNCCIVCGPHGRGEWHYNRQTDLKW